MLWLILSPAAHCRLQIAISNCYSDISFLIGALAKHPWDGQARLGRRAEWQRGPLGQGPPFPGLSRSWSAYVGALGAQGLTVLGGRLSPQEARAAGGSCRGLDVPWSSPGPCVTLAGGHREVK